MIVRTVIGFVYIGVLLAYNFRPGYFKWAAFPLPAWGRWIGAALTFMSLVLLAWVQWVRIFRRRSTCARAILRQAPRGWQTKPTLHVREGHTLVTYGPYKWIRHPMYTALFAFGVGILLLTAN